MLARINEATKAEFDDYKKYISGPRVKPPLGVMPETLWRERRIHDLADAIKRYADEGFLLPIVAEWACEISRLVNEKRKE